MHNFKQILYKATFILDNIINRHDCIYWAAVNLCVTQNYHAKFTKS